MYLITFFTVIHSFLFQISFFKTCTSKLGLIGNFVTHLIFLIIAENLRIITRPPSILHEFFKC